MIRRSLTTALLVLLSACAGTRFEWDDARRLRVGMSEAEVTQIMGTPYLVRSNAEGITWVWSWANAFSGVKTLSVVFQDGKVVKAPSIPAGFH